MPTESRIYNINSSNYLFMNNLTQLSNGIWSFPNLSFVNDNINDVYISILHAEIPNSDYVVNDYNNIIVIQHAFFGPLPFILTKGNYNINTFLIMVNSILATYSYVLTYSSLTNKLTLTAPNNFIILASQSNSRYLFGLGNTDFNSVGVSVIFPFCINLLPTSVFTIKSSAFNINNFGTDNSSDIFLTIQNNGSNGSRCIYSNFSGIKYKLDNPNLNVFDIRIQDEHNNFVNFNGVDWNITFQIDINFRDKEIPLPFEKLIKEATS